MRHWHIMLAAVAVAQLGTACKDQDSSPSPAASAASASSATVPYKDQYFALVPIIEEDPLGGPHLEIPTGVELAEETLGTQKVRFLRVAHRDDEVLQETLQRARKAATGIALGGGRRLAFGLEPKDGTLVYRSYLIGNQALATSAEVIGTKLGEHDDKEATIVVTLQPEATARIEAFAEATPEQSVVVLAGDEVHDVLPASELLSEGNTLAFELRDPGKEAVRAKQLTERIKPQ